MLQKRNIRIVLRGGAEASRRPLGTESVPALHTFFSAARLTTESSTPDDRFPEFSL
jgi:hypothetical protein